MVNVKRTIGTSLLIAGACGILGSLAWIYNIASEQNKSERYIAKNVTPVEQRVSRLETNLLKVLNSDPNIPRDFNGLTAYYNSRVQERNEVNRVPETIRSKRTIEFYTPLRQTGSVVTFLTSSLSIAVGYSLLKKK